MVAKVHGVQYPYKFLTNGQQPAVLLLGGEK
jgi:hypothetical protein